MEYALLLLLMLPPLLLAAYRAWRIRGSGFLDLGVVFAWIVFVYAWLPLLGLILAQHGYGSLQDKRVIDDIPTSGEIVFVGAHYLAFLSGFALVYGWRRNFVPTSTAPVRADKLQVLVVVVVAALVFSVNFLGRFLLGIEAANSYGESYTQILQFPLEVQQVMSGLEQIEFSACLAAVVFMIAWKPHLYRYIAAPILGLLLYAMFSGGSRTFGFLMAFAYLICFSIYVRRLKTTHLLLLAGLGFSMFMFAGILRAKTGFDALMLAPIQDGEFVSVFINSVDLLRQSVKGSGFDVPWEVYWVDFLRFIPQQILGVEKVDPAIWYVTTYYPDYYAIGGGLAFGSIAESVIGFGVAEALARGALLGVVFAFVANRCLSERTGPFKTFIYVWFVLISYQAIRDTTFSVLYRFVFYVLPVLIFVWFFQQVARTLAKGANKQAPAQEDSST